MEKKNKMCKVRLRRLRPDLMDKQKTKRMLSRADVQFSSSSSESDEDDNAMVEKISVQLKSPLDKDFDPFVLLTEAQQALIKKNAMEASEKGGDGTKEFEDLANTTSTAAASSTTVHENSTKKNKHRKQRSHYYQVIADGQSSSKPSLPTQADSIYYHSDGEGPCGYTCNHTRTVDGGDEGAKALSPAVRRRSSTGSSSSLLSDKCSMRFSKLFGSNCISVMDDENPPTALSKILSIKEFDPLAPQQLVALVIKSIVSLSELSQREDNIINVDIDKRRILEFSSLSQEGKKNCRLNPFMDVSNIVVTHPDDEFFTFCLCKNCEEYRELVIHIMVEQFKAAHMVVMLLDVLIKAYGPMLKNITAYNKFEKLLDSNKEIYWITCGVIYHKKGEHLDFIYDEYLSDNMIFVLFSSILMLNNPLLLLQILAFHIECVVKAYAEGFLEIVEPDQSKIPAEEMINYIVNGYDDLIRISEQVASYLFAFENDFLRKFSLTWKLLCQRLYQKHVHAHLADTMLACIITLKEEELTSHHTDLIKRYIHFENIMNRVDIWWTDVWIKLNKFNLSEVERKRRKSLLDVYRIFDTVVQDAIAFSLQDSVDDNDFYDFRSLKNRRLAWKNIMSYTKMKWPDGFYQPPNTLVVDDKCKKCNVSLEYHAEFCKCITCSIAGGPLPPTRNADKCSKCLAQDIVIKDENFYDSKIVNVCANDDFQNPSKNIGSATKPKSSALQEVDEELYVSLEDMMDENGIPSTQQISEIMANGYHIAWAVFTHLNNRKRFPFTTIEMQYFCQNCKMTSCQLARKILNNEISPSLSQDLIHYYQPMSMTREELRAILPNIMLYNRKLVASNNGLDLIDVHDLVVKIYWIFIISVYAIYFIDFDDNNDGEGSTMPNIDALELKNNDICVDVEKIVGNKDDTKFLEFLDKIKSLSPYNNDVESNFDAVVNIDSVEIQKKLNDILKITDNTTEPSSRCENMLQHLCDTAEEEHHHQIPTEINSPSTVESQPKKTCKEKSKKCDHSDIGSDHCKENHSSKKRLKKDCNHARMNETRERLRKKLSQIVNARKTSKSSQSAAIASTASTTNVSEAHNQVDNVLNADELKLFQQFQQQMPHSASWDESHYIAATFEQIHQAKFHDLCECLQHLQTNQKGENNAKSTNKKSQQKQTQPKTSTQQVQQQQPLTSLEPPNKKSNISNNSTRDASTSSQSAKSKERSKEPSSKSSCQLEKPSAVSQQLPSTASNVPASTAPAPSVTSKSSSNLDFVSEICEIIDNYSKEQAKKKWIKETLSFIEGPTAAGKKKSQPQTSNPKKAAKKAKQKQRKDEEKRIAELQDLRGQFQNIYFKEFTDKLSLKSLKANKKRDKKKIGELENNIKNLQRAKAKVETAILELIATVKQTNTEFKFSYLPTKEQQLEKVKEIEALNSDVNESTDAAGAAEKHAKVTDLHQATNEADVPSMSAPFTMAPTNNLNMVPEAYSMPYAHANHFPYNLGFPPAAATGPAPFGLIRATPMCYAPPAPGSGSQQQLGPDVVATMSANSSSSSDPSKRIVTIRRVNLPNVPEPQVTVTAKGSSPDKDKLLYTFINGQLVQTSGAAPPIAIPQMPVISPMQPPSAPSYKLPPPPEHLLTIPPPPPPQLSKSQMKKERRRLAKLQAEADAAEEAERKRLEEEHQRIRALEEQRQRELEQQQQQKQSKKKKKKQNIQQQSAKVCQSSTVSSCPTTKKENKTKQKQNKLVNSNSTTSVSTNENNETPLQLPQIMMQKASKQKRSVSTTTSCSAATSSSSSSNNSTSSQMNTRDNSVSSLKPGNAAKCSSSKMGGTKKQQVDSKNTKSKNNKNKPNSKKKSATPTSSAITSEDENEQKLVMANQSKPQQLVSSKQKQTNGKKQHKTAGKPQTPPSSDSEGDDNADEPSSMPQKSAPQEKKQPKKRRPKLIDNGQFDNNPFKSLHMQDSESEWTSSDDDDEEEHCDGDGDVLEIESQIKNLNLNTQKLSTEIAKNVKQPENNQKSQIAKKASRDGTDTKSPNTIRGPAVKQQNKSTANKPTKPPVSDNNKHPSSTIAAAKQNSTQQTTNIRLSKHTSASMPQNTVASSNRKGGKADNRSTSGNVTPQQTSTAVKAQPRNNTRNSNRSQNSIPNIQQPASLDDNHYNPKVSSTANCTASAVDGKGKRIQRNKKFQQKNQKSNQSQHQHCCSGIPENMGYFNPNDVHIAPSSSVPSHPNLNAQSCSYQSLSEQMQSMRLSGNVGPQQQRLQHNNSNTAGSNNVSIMDQLNRGVQVENLSLPPGITLTKVDPIKSEQLRQKSESIKKLAKPLQAPTPMSQTTQAFHHGGIGTTIIAPPVTPLSNYYGSHFSAGTAGMMPTAALDPQSGIIMVEANPPKSNTTIQSTNIASCTTTTGGKQSKNKKRRNKSKASNNNSSCPLANSAGNAKNQESSGGTNVAQPKMITLRNPMFHGGPAGAPATILPQAGLMQGRPLDTYPVAAPLPVDQPAAIIKNENGMYTIRNPALHQAVTNGLVLGGYRQFGNVNFYTPQEAAAEAARATLQQQQQQPQTGETTKNATTAGNMNTNSFSYFSNDNVPTNATHNNISISCTSVGTGRNISSPQRAGGGGLTGDAAVIQRPTPAQKCISAIGSEIKNAQQQKQKSKEQHWSHFGTDSLPMNKNDNACNSSFLGTVADGPTAGVDVTLQEKYQQSKYYNGFDVFTGSSGGSSSSATTAAHIHHSCGDDSPPPSITGYNSYLEGIPNTGVIRYDDASFLKNLIPGQNLNTEVSIHNVNDSNFARNANSPQAHRVEITPVYGGNRPASSASLFEANAVHNNQTNFRGNYRDPYNDSNIFSNNNINMNLGELDSAMKYDFESTQQQQQQPPTTAAKVASSDNHNSILDFNDLLNNKNGPTGPASHRTSPYMDDNTLEGFVQNINSLRISSNTTAADEPSSQINGNGGGIGHTVTTSANTNGWW
ncbi:uncharacterized protein [Musca autumnalis]|uniref:uncharacterized protein n=1 Tax=Musca autumnalis TaxID=221902 RepID=UPI003CE71406